ncbi:DEAD/DEAH box helicase [Alkalibacterium olivapovliticus]|uniref:DEAD-box ATP-dependent RNA helicase CshA n=1 Tax=Alkalibacterium olivapovliticus TaxID=99907 RepID=A0A2T0W5B1_9LACT|nr:DEAD/DEAH box helicase [Alkalibacterium olivapovliticus]PRY80945.1 ATP-dependent RNA helicase DeaD [Alkalibacterium olivapovliticus]
MKFNELDLKPELLKSIQAMGFEETTPIQEQTIPLALEGRDVIGQAQTGTGKTAAFGLPMLQKIDVKNHNVQGLVIAPTRELAIQTQEEIFRLSKDKRVKVTCVYGGADISRQIKQIKGGAQIVVGTPGRMLDLIRRKALRLNQVETLVLDEADEMLNMGFIEDIETIIKEVPAERQTLLFSATMPAPIKRIGERFMTNPEMVSIKTKTLSASTIEQFYTKARDNEKFDIMTRLLDVQNPKSTILFARTKRRVDELAKGLEMRGYQAEGIHGDLSQSKRMSVLKDFKKGNIDILVATDVAARGLDVTGLSHVYNYDIPQDPESYIHRIGRTGRAGEKGVAVTFVTPHEMGYLRTVESLTKQPMTSLRPPTNDEALESQLQTAMADIQKMVDENGLDKYENAAEKLLSSYSAEDLAAALIKTIVKDAEEVPVKITPQRPLPSKDKRRGGGGKGGNRNYGGNKGKGGNRSSNYKGKGRAGDNKGKRSTNSRRSSNS